ncbi:MAG: ABC transporter permease [Candidatus Limnocylindrales bacterium]
MTAGVRPRDFLALPLPGLGGRHLVERNVLVYRRTFWVIFSGFFEPLFYLLGIGFGLGALIGTVTGPNGTPISYQLFIAPALMATSAMNGAIYDSTINVFFKLNFQRTYDGVLATPLGVVDVAVGEIGWALIRGTLYSIGFIVVMFALGLVASPLAILAVPAAMLIGFAFAAVGMAATTFMRKIQDFDMLNLVQVPLFLFSATFFPLSVYPPALQVIVQLTPLYHGIALIRELTLGIVGPDLLVHVAYLVVMGVIGLAICSRRLGYLLRK